MWPEPVLLPFVFVTTVVAVAAFWPSPVPPAKIVEDALLRRRDELATKSPSMWLLMATGAFLARYGLPLVGSDRMASLERKLRRAGWPAGLTAQEYVGICVGGGLLVGVLLELIARAIMGYMIGVTIVAGVALGYFVSARWIDEYLADRAKRIDRRLPHILDLLTVSMAAGSTFQEALAWICQRPSDEPLDEELRLLASEMHLGRSRQEAIGSLIERCGSRSVTQVFNTILQGERLGTPLQVVLRNQAQAMRQARILIGEELARKASIKVLAPSVLILLATLGVILGPMIMEMATGF